ncbi:hypothetical protein G4B88_024283 [Cannabis sativa]|uniref:Uncharacterized protein n=1 Tax=Cannabis sativa TaxID=3483 RepID=A0A7J6DNH4_CANSA|nr:hypothetical protein G4B88_024283 [Cannabis sativa]
MNLNKSKILEIDIVGEMALVSGERSSSSSLNPNAPLFVPAALKQVEDFSPEWWDILSSPNLYEQFVGVIGQKDVKAILLKSMKESEVKWEKMPVSYREKPVQKTSPKVAHFRIQQPR